jgi:hypothetical protein
MDLTNNNFCNVDNKYNYLFSLFHLIPQYQQHVMCVTMEQKVWKQF